MVCANSATAKPRTATDFPAWVSDVRPHTAAEVGGCPPFPGSPVSGCVAVDHAQNLDYKELSARQGNHESAMTIHLRPDLEAILQAQVAAGRFESVDAALEAAIQGMAMAQGDLSWATPFLAEADADIAAGRVRTHAQVWADCRLPAAAS